ncbi:MAG: hypothetical protein IPJ74_05040 [Saprospiraceae bacterium]|nr:hypothetical protein [Saprospiraceae bacterium]
MNSTQTGARKQVNHHKPGRRAVSYAMRHRYQIDNETVEEEITLLADLQIALMLNPLASLHEFTALTTCEDGTTAEGATFSGFFKCLIRMSTNY